MDSRTTGLIYFFTRSCRSHFFSTCELTKIWDERVLAAQLGVINSRASLRLDKMEQEAQWSQIFFQPILRSLPKCYEGGYECGDRRQREPLQEVCQHEQGSGVDALAALLVVAGPLGCNCDVITMLWKCTNKGRGGGFVVSKISLRPESPGFESSFFFSKNLSF